MENNAVRRLFGCQMEEILRILGIDPGYAIIGYGIVDYNCEKFKTINFGAITTKAHTPFEKRLNTIFDDLNELLDTYKPEAIALEKLFFNTPKKSIIRRAFLHTFAGNKK